MASHMFTLLRRAYARSYVKSVTLSFRLRTHPSPGLVIVNDGANNGVLGNASQRPWLHKAILKSEWWKFTPSILLLTFGATPMHSLLARERRVNMALPRHLQRKFRPEAPRGERWMTSEPGVVFHLLSCISR